MILHCMKGESMITDAFDNTTEPLVSLADFYGEQKHMMDRCLVTFSGEIHRYLLQHFPCERIAEITSANGSCPVYETVYGGVKTAFYLSPIGSTLAAQAVMEVSWVTGAEHFVMFGSAGSLDPEVTEGKYVIPSWSYRDEGMSYHYAPPQDYICIRNYERVAACMDELHLPHVIGKVWTTDAFLRETKGQVRKRREEGCIAVEMELAGVQAVCDFCGLQLYDFLVTGDVLAEEGYDNSGLSTANHDTAKLYAALELIRRI